MTLIQLNKNITFAVCVPSHSSSSYLTEIMKYSNVTVLIWENNTEHLLSMQKSAIVLSCAYQENFWFAVHKAIAQGCLPILPNRAVYPEIFAETYLYNSIEQANDMIRAFSKNPSLYAQEIKKLQNEYIKQLTITPLIKNFFEL